MKTFKLDTKHTSYLFSSTPSGHLEHLHYGLRIDAFDLDLLREKTPYPTGLLLDKNNKISLEDLPLEFSTYGKGDIREAMVEIETSDGNRVGDFRYVADRELENDGTSSLLPASRWASRTLEVETFDAPSGMTLLLTYRVYADVDVIVRSCRLRNDSDKKVVVHRLMSAQIDLNRNDLIWRTFDGHWGREREVHEKELNSGILVNDSKTGLSSNRHNPLVILRAHNCDDQQGECYGLNLIYSGNHATIGEVNSYGKSHIVWGINPHSFAYPLFPGETLESPQAVLTYSNQGINRLSRHFHDFVNKHLIPMQWQNKARPVLINSWEATYFNFNETKLMKLAKTARDVGIELFVLDDGWFGKRDDDTSSLGDWEVNKKKLRGGLKRLSDKIHALDMQFGLWVEPEMISENSDLYRSHPDWAITIPGREPSIGRNQLVLDLANPEVQESLIATLTRLFASARIEYVKWDMNRNLSDLSDGSHNHRYILGLYKVLDNLTSNFPEILFESCASGGNRFDLGMLAYMPQIWTSDNTDALCRVNIQNATSQGYPLSTMGAHVSAVPNHQTQRISPLETRFQVACFGVLGYELNLNELSADTLTVIKNQITFYKQYRELFQCGTFYRISPPNQSNLVDWMVVSSDKETAILMHFQDRAIANPTTQILHPVGLNEEYMYDFSNRSFDIDIGLFGDLINMVSPIRIKQDSFLHKVVRKMKVLHTETEHGVADGRSLMHGGIKLKQSNVGGFNDETRIFPDGASRIYLFKRIEKEKDDSTKSI
jgi:alpha-galactosidase